MNEVFGTFIITLENQNFTAEFFNNHLDHFIPETIIPSAINGSFAGTYSTEWYEDDKRCEANLAINEIATNLFNLRWTNVKVDDENANVTFEGRGVLRNNILTSVYRQV